MMPLSSLQRSSSSSSTRTFCLVWLPLLVVIAILCSSSVLVALRMNHTSLNDVRQHQDLLTFFVLQQQPRTSDDTRRSDSMANCNNDKEAFKAPTARFVPHYNWQFSDEQDQANLFDGVPARVWPISKTQQQQQHHQQHSDIISRVPCFQAAAPDWWKLEARATRPTPTGFFLQKTWKTGSSTAVGVHLRIATQQAQRQQLEGSYNNKNNHSKQQQAICDNRFAHAAAADMYANRVRFNNSTFEEEASSSPFPSFLWTTFRDPTLRAMSQFFHFDVSRYKKEPSDANFQKMLQEAWIYEHYATYSSLSATPTPLAVNKNKQKNTVVPQTMTTQERAARLLMEYDFVAVTERFDESMVVLALILNIPLTDVLYVKPGKGNGGYDDGMGRVKNKRICTYITPAFCSPGMREYFASAEWQQRVHWDHMLYLAANRSLDLTIEAINTQHYDQNRKLKGETFFAQKLAEYRTLQQRVHDACAATVQFPCTAGGAAIPFEQTDCLWHDSGCGDSCINRVILGG